MQPLDYWHNRQIKIILDEVRKKAWAQISTEPEVVELIESARSDSKIRAQQQLSYPNPTQDLLLPYR